MEKRIIENIGPININSIIKNTFLTFFLLGATLVLSYNYAVPSIANSLMFHPYNPKEFEFDILSHKYKRNEQLINFQAIDGTKISGMFVNYNKQASWDDVIFLYSHGNGAWIGELLNSPHIKMLSNYGSIFAYDYRGYGFSDGIINEKGTYSDIKGAWNYLVNIKKINPKKIIVYGHSMGGAVSTKLVSSLVKHKEELPSALLIHGTFSNTVDMGNHLLPGLGGLSPHNYDNIKNLQYINGALPILIMHSPLDETVPYSQSLKIKENCACTHITIDGTHNVPIFNSETISFIEQVSREAAQNK